LPSAGAQTLEYGNVEVIQLNDTNNNFESDEPSVSVTMLSGSTDGFTIRGGNRGDFDLGFGNGGQDQNFGILIPTVRENTRNNFAGGAEVNGLNFANTGIAFGGAGYWVPTASMGGSAEHPNGRSEYNISFNMGYFPYDQFVGAHASVVSNGGALGDVRSSPGIGLGRQIFDYQNGVFKIDLRDVMSHGVPATPENGILLAVHGKNEGNFAMAQDNEDGTFTLSVMDNGQYGGNVRYEQDSFGFVYLPTNLAGRNLFTAMGRIQSDGSTEVAGGDFTVTPRTSLTSLGSELATGTFESELTDDEGTFATTLDDFENKTYLLEILSGPDVGQFFEISAASSETALTLASGSLTAVAEDYPVDYRIGEAGSEYLLTIPGKNPANGALLVTPAGGASEADPLPNNTDNFVSHEWSPDENAWILQSRDVPQGFLTQKGLTDDEDLFNFVFLTTEPANEQPEIALTGPTPSDGSEISQGSTVTLTADATDAAPGGVANVEFFLNGVSQVVDTAAPYEFTTAPLNELGTYVVNAIVTDNDSATATTASRIFSIVPPAGSGGLYFNGVDDYVTFGEAPSLGLTTFTLETWFKPEGDFGQTASTGVGGVSGYPLIAKGRGESDRTNVDCNYFLGIRASDGVLVADFEDIELGTNIPVTGRTSVEAGQWQHAAVTFDGSEWKLYLNGNLEATRDAGGLLPRADSIQHASLASALNSEGTPAGFFQGFLDESRIWNVARSQEEIRASLDFEVASESGLLARFAMTEDSGSTLTSTAAGNIAGDILGLPNWANGYTFGNNVRATVALTEPTDGSSFDLGETITLSATASDPDGSVSQVEFFQNGSSIAVDSSAPYTAELTLSSPEPRVIIAVATDSAGDTSRSAVSIVDISLPAPSLSGYSVGVVNGGSLDIDTPGYTPDGNDTFEWVIEASRTSPALTSFDSNRGDFTPLVNGELLAGPDGMAFGTNFATLDNLAPLDNSIAPDNDGDNIYLSILDNEAPGAADPGTAEESGRFSFGFFPWADGWFGADVASDGSPHRTSNFPEGANVTVSNTAEGRYEISGLPTSGNLIATSIDNSNENVVSVAREDTRWIVTSRANTGVLENEEFGYLYVPSATPQVFSGLVENDGNIVPLNDELELLGASVNLGAQGYEITIGDGSVINPSNSVMFLTGDFANGAGGDNIYSYFANGDTFVVFSHDLPFLTRQFQQGGFRFLIMPLDPGTRAGDEVVITASDATTTEGGDSGTFTFTRFGDTAQPLTVSIATGGNATSGTDYTALPSSVTFPASSSTTTLEVQALSDGFLELAENIEVTLLPGTGYSVGSYSLANISITNVNPTVATTTVSFQEGMGGYTGQFGLLVGEATNADTGEKRKELGTDEENFFLDGPADSGSDTNSAIRFDNIFGNGPGQIPPGAGVQDARLVITTSTVSNAQSGGPFNVDRLIDAVNESTTYDTLDRGAGFEGLRGGTNKLPVAGFGDLEAGAVTSANVTALVQSWAAGSPNHGFVLYSGGTTNGWGYNTVGNPNPEFRPKLEVTYTTNTTLKDYFYDADLNTIINNTQGESGSVLDASTIISIYTDLNDATTGTTEALLRFPVSFGSPEDLNSIPQGETIVKAELLLTTTSPGVGTGTGNSQTGGPYAIHQMLVDWDTETTFGLTGPVVPGDIAEATTRLVGMGQFSATFGDVTPVVQNWRAGAPNYGFNIKPETTDGWNVFWSGTQSDPGLASNAPLLRVTTAILESTAFDDYAAANGDAGANFLDDEDQDGIPSLMEYALGLNLAEKDTLPGLVANGNGFSLSFTKGTEGAADPRLEYIIETSTDLETWTEMTPAVDDGSEISAAIPGPDLPERSKIFARLRVDYN
jgi:hypothetical protein